jgi:hypothetical protein
MTDLLASVEHQSTSLRFVRACNTNTNLAVDAAAIAEAQLELGQI